MDCPPSCVILSRILTRNASPSIFFSTTCPRNSLDRSSLVELAIVDSGVAPLLRCPQVLAKIADDANTKASPALSRCIFLKISDSLLSGLPIHKCFRSALSQSGLVNRWIIVTATKSIRRGDSVGSWVAMMTRVARWRCWRMIVRRVSERVLDAAEVVPKYYSIVHQVISAIDCTRPRICSYQSRGRLS